MKTLLVLPAMPEDSPFLKYYTDWYVENNIDFDIVCLNRKSYDTKKTATNVPIVIFLLMYKSLAATLIPH